MPSNVRYYTRPTDFKDVHVVGGRAVYSQGVRREYPATTATCNEAIITHHWLGYSRVWRSSGIAFDRIRLFLPDTRFQTQAAYVRCAPLDRVPCGARAQGTVALLRSSAVTPPHTTVLLCSVPVSARAACRDEGLDYDCGMHAAKHALLNVLPLFLLCNPSDVATECESEYSTRLRPSRLLVHDSHPGGLGLAAKVCFTTRQYQPYVLHSTAAYISHW